MKSEFKLAVLAGSSFLIGAASAADFTFLTDSSFEGLVTTDPYLGNADDQFFLGINTIGGASQFVASNGVYGFLGGVMTTQGLTDFGPHPQQIFGLNEHISNDMFGEWNFNPTSTFNQPITQSLDTGSPTSININRDQTYTTSFVLNDNVSGGRLQLNGTGQYLLNGQVASDFYAGDVLIHFDTVTPLLPFDWQGVAQESQTWTVLDGPNAGVTGFTTSTFFTTDPAAVPTEPPVPLGGPWLTTGFVATTGGPIQVGGDIGPFFGLGGSGTAGLSGGDIVSEEGLIVGTFGGDSGNVLLSDDGTAFDDGIGATVSNGSISVSQGAHLEIDTTNSGAPAVSAVNVQSPDAMLSVDGPGSEVRVRGGSANAFNLFFGEDLTIEGTQATNYVSFFSGGTGQVTNGAKIVAEGENISLISVGGFPIVSVGESSLLADGTGSLVDGGSLLLVGSHPLIQTTFNFPQDPGVLEVRNEAIAKANTIYIGIDGTVKGNNGTLEGMVKNHGTVMPGASPGVLNIIGDYIQDAEGTLVIEIGGTAPGMFDVLNVSGTATLGGTLQIDLVNGFTPQESDTFAFLVADIFAGDFDNFVLPTFGNNQTFAVSLGPNGFTADVAPIPVPAALWLFAPGIAALGFARRKTH